MPENTILASRDLAALRQALPLFIDYAARSIESPLIANRREMRKATAVNPERFENPEPAPQIADAIEWWIAHLAWLDFHSSAVAWGAGDLDSDEAEGLALFRRAHKTYWSEHVSCPGCQSVNLRDAGFCGGCGKDFKGGR